MGFKFYFVSQILIFSLKIDKSISITWQQSLVPYWFFFSIISSIALGFGIIFFGKSYQKCIDTSVSCCESKKLGLKLTKFSINFSKNKFL